MQEVDIDADLKFRVALFNDAFGFTADDAHGENSTVGNTSTASATSMAPTENPAVVLVRKLVAVLEHVENLPVVVHDSPGSGHGLQVLTRQLKFKLKRFPGEGSVYCERFNC